MADDLATAVVSVPEANGVRVGEVSQEFPLRVTLQGGPVASAGVLMSGWWPQLGQPVALLRQGETWMVLGAVGNNGAAVPSVSLGARVGSLVSSGALFAEAVSLTVPSFTFRSGLAYRIRYSQNLDTTAANNFGIQRVRVGSVAGTILDACFWTGSPLDFIDGLTRVAYARRTAATDLTASLVHTMQGGGAAIVMSAGADNERFLEVEPCGFAADPKYATTTVIT